MLLSRHTRALDTLNLSDQEDQYKIQFDPILLVRSSSMSLRLDWSNAPELDLALVLSVP
jgi:hypothetical protein